MLIKNSTKHEDYFKNSNHSKSDNHFFKSFFNNAPIAMAMTRIGEKHFYEVNNKFCNLFNYTKEELLQLSYLDITSKEDIEHNRNITKDLLAGKENSIKREKHYIRKNGSIFSGELVVSIVKDRKGKPSSYIIFIFNISEQKDTEEKLIKNEEKYKAIFNNSADGIIYIENNGKIIDVNKTVFKNIILPFSSKNIFGKNIFEISQNLISKKDVEKFSRITNAIKNQKNIKSFELELKNKKIYKISPRFLEKRNKLVVLIKDVTETRKITKALKESDELHKKIVQNQGEGMGIVDTNEVFIFSNPAAHEIFGVPKGTLNGKKVTDFLDDKGKKIIKTETNKRLKGERSTYELNIIRPDKERRTILLTASPQCDDKGNTISTFGIYRDITHRKKTEQALQDSEEKYRLIIDNIKDVVWKMDLNLNLTFISPSIEKITGYSTVEYLKLKPHEKYSKNTLLKIKSTLRELIKNIKEGKTTNNYINYTETGELINKKGDIINIEFKASPVFINNNLIEIQGITRDISQKIKVQGKLKNSEKSLRKAQKISKVASWEMDLINKKFSCSDEFYNIYEIEKDDISSSFDITNKYIHPDDKKLILFSENKIPQKKDLISIEFRIITPNNKTKWISSYNPEIIYKNNKAIKVIGINQDITKRKNAEIRLEQKSTELKILLDLIPAYVYFKDINLNYITVNKALANLSKYSEAEIIGKNDLGIWDKETAKIYRENDQEAINSGKPRHNIVEKVERKDGSTFWSSTSKVPYYNKNKILKGLIGITWDISEIKENEEKLKEAITEAKKANKLKSEFLANMSHEIRTPMNAILGFSEILKTKLSDFPEYSNLINGIYNSGKNLLQLINDILDLSKIEAGKLKIQKQEVNVYNIIKEFKNIFLLKLDEKNLDFNINIDKNLPKILILDQTRMRQILFNLIGNAIKFTKQGSISISIKIRNKTKNKVDLYIEVKDTGIGIAKEKQKEIFEAFVQQDSAGKRHYEGTGLGLAITKRLVKMMNGEISVTSKLNIGSSFKVHLKNVEISDIEDFDNSKEDENYKNIKFEKKTVLLVEDLESNREVIKSFLSMHNIEIIEAENGKIAIDEAKKTKPSLILMDIEMPIMTGDISAKIIKENPKLKSIPIIALTAYAMKEQVDKYKDIFDDYIVKPVSEDTLITKLTKYLPYTKIDSKHKITKSQDYISELKNIKHSFNENFISEINNEVIPLYSNITEGISIDEITRFTDKIIKISNKYNIKPLLDYATKLKQVTLNFNFAEIEKLTKLFIDIKKILIS